ncbi:MAG: hypothetical protein AB8G05_13690 [Oligoflexales bacterium]
MPYYHIKKIFLILYILFLSHTNTFAAKIEKIEFQSKIFQEIIYSKNQSGNTTQLQLKALSLQSRLKIDPHLCWEVYFDLSNKKTSSTKSHSNNILVFGTSSYEVEKFKLEFGKDILQQGGNLRHEYQYFLFFENEYNQNDLPFPISQSAISVLFGNFRLQVTEDVSVGDDRRGEFNHDQLQPAFLAQLEFELWPEYFRFLNQFGSYDINHSRFLNIVLKASFDNLYIRSNTSLDQRMIRIGYEKTIREYISSDIGVIYNFGNTEAFGYLSKYSIYQKLNPINYESMKTLLGIGKYFVSDIFSVFVS